MKPLRHFLAFALLAPLMAQSATATVYPPGSNSCSNGYPPDEPPRTCTAGGGESDADSSGSSGDTGSSDAAPRNGGAASIDSPTTLVSPNGGGASMATTDLVVPHATGDLPLAFSRTYRSRDIFSAADQMGHGRAWTHSYSWTMWASGTNGTGRTILFPSGYALDFTVVSGTIDFEGQPSIKLMAPAGFGERIYQVGNFYHLVMPGGVRHTFERVTNPDTTVRYVPRYSKDLKGNAHNYTTDSKSRIIRVDDAAGNWIALTYAGIQVNRKQNIVLHTITAKPVVGWNEVTVTATQPFRWVQGISAPEQRFRMSEVEFYKEGATAGSTVKLGGTAYGTDPALNSSVSSTFDKVFDGNTSSEFIFARPSGGVAGLDLGAAGSATVKRIRYYIPGTYSASLGGFIGHQFVGCVESPQVVTILSQVTTSTGQTANYQYSEYLDPSISQNHLVLDRVEYGTGANATFSWISAQEGSSPSVLRLTEPRNQSATPDLAFDYFPANLSVKGQPYQVMAGATSSVIFTSEPKDTHKFVAADGGVHTVANTNTNDYLPSSSKDAAGKTTTYTWNSRNFLATRTTPDGTVTCDYNYMGIPVSVTHPDGLTESYTCDVQGRLLTRALSAPGQATRTTTYTRDSLGRATRITQPDGSYEDYTYNGLGLVTLIRERNGSHTRHTYDATGLRSATIRGLSSATATDGETTSFTWYAAGNASGSPARMLASVTDPRGRTTAYQYDSAGRLLKTTYPDGSFRQVILDDFGNKTNEFDGSSTEQWTYDAFRRPLAHTDAANGVTSYDYGLNGNACSCYGAGAPTLITSPAGRKTRRYYDLKGRLVQEIRGYLTTDAATTTNTYNTLGRLTSTTGPDGHVTTHTYDSMGRTLSTTIAPTGLNLTTTHAYSAFGDTLGTTAPGGRATSMTYDTMSRAVSITDPLGTITAVTYDLGGRRTAVTEADGTALVRNTNFSYDLFDRLTGTTWPDSTTTSQTYHPGGEPATSTDELGRTTSQDSALVTWTDSLAQTWTSFASTTTDPGGFTTTSYGPPMAFTGGTRRIVSPGGRIAETYTDELGRTTLSRSGLVTSTSGLTADVSDTVMTHDADGLVLTSTTDPTGLNLTTTRTYDALRRTKTAKDPLNRTTTYTYDKRGNLVKTKLPDNREHTATYDALSRQLTATDPKSQTITYTYWNDTSSQLTLKDARNQTTTWTYNLRGQLLTKVYANGDDHAYTYDALGRMATHTTPMNEVCTYSYDLRDRQTLANWNSTTPATAKTYWANGLLKSVDNGVSKSDYAYNSRNLLTSETQTLSGQSARVVGYDYDADGLRSNVAYPSAKLVELAWTARAQLAAVTSDGPPPFANYTHDKAGRVTAVIHENGITESKSYDATSQLLANTHLKGGSAVAGHGYTLDSTGRRTAETFADGTTAARSYGYDTADQVISATYGSSLTDAYNYDAAGNRSTATVASLGGTSTTYNANNANQYTSVTGLTPISHDANGNLTLQNGVNYGWDSENDLLSVTPTTPATGDKSLVHTYDGQHRRVTRTIREWTGSGWSNLETTHFIYDGWNVIEEYALGGGGPTLQRNFTWGLDLSGSLQGAGGVGGLLMAEEITGTTTAYHFHYDGNGNVTEITDLSGNPAASYRYDAFGNTLVSIGSYAAQNRYRFSTKPLDREVASAPLYYYGYRYYDPVTGRWLSRDPIEEEGGLNLYGFLENNSVNFSDRLGLLDWKNEKVEYQNFSPGSNVTTAVGTYSTKTNHLAVALPDWKKKAYCECENKDKKYYLIGFDVNFTPVVFLRPSYISEAQKRWVLRAENDHSDDYYTATFDARTKVEKLESQWDKDPYDTMEACKNKNLEKLETELDSIFKKAITDTIANHDTPGKHTWTGPNQRQ